MKESLILIIPFYERETAAANCNNSLQNRPVPRIYNLRNTPEFSNFANKVANLGLSKE